MSGFGELLKPYGVYILLKILEYEISLILIFRKKNFINNFQLAWPSPNLPAKPSLIWFPAWAKATTAFRFVCVCLSDKDKGTFSKIQLLHNLASWNLVCILYSQKYDDLRVIASH